MTRDAAIGSGCGPEKRVMAVILALKKGNVRRDAASSFAAVFGSLSQTRCSLSQTRRSAMVLCNGQVPIDLHGIYPLHVILINVFATDQGVLLLLYVPGRHGPILVSSTLQQIFVLPDGQPS